MSTGVKRRKKKQTKTPGFEDPFYQAEILSRVEKALGRDCEIEDVTFEKVYWSGGYEIRGVNMKIRCKGANEGDDVILVATIGRLHEEGGKVVNFETYQISKVVDELLKKYEILYRS